MRAARGPVGPPVGEGPSTTRAGTGVGLGSAASESPEARAGSGGAPAAGGAELALPEQRPGARAREFGGS